MAGDRKRRYDIEYARILAEKIRNVPAWKDFANACQAVLGQSVDERRRRLEKIRDSVKYRRGDTLVDVVYKPEEDKPAYNRATNTLVVLPENYVIRTAKVRNVISRISTYKSPNSSDYLELVFIYNNEEVTWLKPTSVPQERDALLKNSYIMGFDFFNTKLGDEDLQRLYEFIQLYWPESGTNKNYLDFIGFIKNTRIDMVHLWSYDDGTDFFPELEARSEQTVPAYQGGKHYLTNHVELRLDLAQFGEYYTVDLNDLEALFYYFAPIIVVLERVVLYLEYPPAVINTLTTAQLNVSTFGNFKDKIVFETTCNIGLKSQQQLMFYAVNDDYQPGKSGSDDATIYDTFNQIILGAGDVAITDGEIEIKGRADYFDERYDVITDENDSPIIDDGSIPPDWTITDENGSDLRDENLDPILKNGPGPDKNANNLQDDFYQQVLDTSGMPVTLE